MTDPANLPAASVSSAVSEHTPLSTHPSPHPLSSKISGEAQLANRLAPACPSPEEGTPVLGCTNTTKSSTESEIPHNLARRLYISHFISTWNFRGFEFGAVLFLAAIFPDTLLPLSIYAMVRSLAAIIFGPLVGRYIDTSPRLKIVRNSIVYQRGAVVVSCVVFYVMIWRKPHLEVWGLYGLLALTIVLACVEKLCAIMNTVSIERDWVVVIAGNNAEGLRNMNSKMRRIDLFCKLCSPLTVALLETYATKFAITIMCATNAFSVIAEYALIARVYNAFPSLHRRNLSLDRNSDDLAQDESPVAPEPAGLSSLLQNMKMYASQGAFLPSISLSILYLTVLSFGGQMVTFLLASGYTSAMIAVIRLVSTACEMSATWMAPPIMARIGPIRSGLWFLNFQMACLAAALAIFWTTESPVWAATGLVGGTTFSRIGLWGFDLSAQAIIQEQVEPEYRGVFSTTESSLQNFFELCSYSSTILFADPSDFKYPAMMSVAAVYTAGAVYAGFVRRRRGHLVHVSKCIESRKAPEPEIEPLFQPTGPSFG